MLTAEQAVELCESLEGARVRYWVAGGWGVDALLARETRSHKDLDILALIDDVAHLRRMFEEKGFTLSRVWKESRWIEGAEEAWPTAFVAEDAIGRAIDVHLIGISPDGSIVQYYENRWPLPASFAASGIVAGRTIPCVSAEAQVKMHVGYTVPDEQRLDLELLRGQVTFTDPD